MKKEKALEKFTEVQYFLTSQNGYPVFDLMLPLKEKGYVGASNIVFYTEETKKIKEFNQLRTQEDQQNFFKENLQYIHNLSELTKNGLQLMTNKESMAFYHMNTPTHLEKTLREHFYGVLHLMLNDKIVLFETHSPNSFKGANEENIDFSYVLKDQYKLIDLNEEKHYMHLQKELKALYEQGKIKPVGQLIEKSFTKVKKVLENKMYYKFEEMEKNSNNNVTKKPKI